jgi:tetratricopeptide (TPR) repeat protein
VSAAWLLILSGAPSLSAQDVDSEAQRHFLAAQQAQQSGNLEAAVREYTAVLRLRPGIAEVYGNLGLIYYLEGNFEESSKAFEKAVFLKSGLRGADLFLGIDYVRLYHAQRAVPHLKRAVEQEPANKQARSWLCSALWDSGQPATAIQQLRVAVHDFPGDADFLFLLGEAYRKAANREVGQVVSATPPTSPFYHQVFGDIYSTQRDWEKAIVHYRRALEIDPRWPGAHYGLAGVYLQRNQTADARAELLLELKVNPSSTRAKAMLAQIARRQDQPVNNTQAIDTPAPAAVAKLLSHLAADSQDLQTRYLLGKTYQKLSLSVLSQLLAADPGSFRAHQLKAQTYAAREENDKALAEYRIVEEARPDLPGLHFAIGQLLWKARDTDRALAELRKELRLNPDHAEANAEIGDILVSLHQPDEAIPYLQKALRLKPDLIRIHEQLGRAFYQRKEFAQAAREFSRLLSTDNDGDVHYELGRVYEAMGLTGQSRAALEASRKIKAERLANFRIEKGEELDP